MSSPAQAAANAANAQASTGPRTEEGKSTSSKNAIVYGLFSGDFVRPGEEDDYKALITALYCDLAPVGSLEAILAEEITRAAWRLRRCGRVESHIVVMQNDGEQYILDPMEDKAASHIDKVQKSVDRARAQAHRLMHKATAELRKLQTERQFRDEHLETGHDPVEYGLANRQSIAKTPMKSTKPPVTQGTQSEPAGTPRNAPCPCGSGQKHKRCCGKEAPAMAQAA